MYRNTLVLTGDYLKTGGFGPDRGKGLFPFTAPCSNASSHLRTTSTFCSDIAYSDSPAASRASLGSK